MYYLNILPLSYEYLYRRDKFLSKLNTSENCLLSKLSVLFGAQGLVNIDRGLHIHKCDVKNMCAIKQFGKKLKTVSLYIIAFLIIVLFDAPTHLSNFFSNNFEFLGFVL